MSFDHLMFFYYRFMIYPNSYLFGLTNKMKRKKIQRQNLDRQKVVKK